jgi:serine/threonine protein kinase
MSPTDLVLLTREMGNMKKVEHPNVLRLREVFDTDTELAMVMDLVAGGELFYKIVERGNYSEKDAAHIIRQVIEGVAYLHSEGIAHRDLKPENLLCTEGTEKIGDKEFHPFRVVIADFGLSKSFDDGKALTTSCGTPEYVAPEVITAEGSYDKSVDMWSVGVIVYVLLCGFSPFGGGPNNDPSTLFDKIIKAEYDFPDPEWTNISSQAKDFIRHLLVKDIDERWTAEQCKKHDWLNGSYGTDAPLAGGDIARRITQYHLKRKEDMKK